jgi:hypothetical protein
MSRILDRWKPITLSKYERLTLLFSVVSLGFSLFAAVLSPLVTYYWVDPQARDYKERGFLVQTSRAVWDTGFVGQSGLRPELGYDDITVTLVNAGRRPVKEISIFLGRPGQSLAGDVVGAEGRVVEKVKTDAQYSLYLVSGALAPSETLTLRMQVGHNTGATIVTEHGDRLNVYETLAPVASERK